MACSMVGLHALVLHADFPANTPERAAFKAHLVNVAKALREIEHTEDGEPKPEAEAAAIQACLSGFKGFAPMHRAVGAH